MVIDLDNDEDEELEQTRKDRDDAFYGDDRPESQNNTLISSEHWSIEAFGDHLDAAIDENINRRAQTKSVFYSTKKYMDNLD